jgi:adenylate cyclase
MVLFSNRAYKSRWLGWLTETERRLAAIIFTDMVGYTALTQANESLSLEVLARQYRLLRPIFLKYHGREVKTMGDSFLVEFDSALDATNCSVKIQRFLHDYNLSSRDEWKVRLRIGVHLGDVIHAAGDVLGDAVNIASRIEPLAEAEGVCVSEQVFDQVRNKISQPLVKLAQRDLKNIQFPIDVYKVVMPWEESAVPRESHETPRNLRLAVLPFTNMSPDPQDEFFADGLTEEMISELSRIRGLRVIARTSIMHYKNASKGVQEIGRELKVGSILEGSVRKAGNKIRITAQLIDAGNEEHMWAGRYDRELNDIFAVQTEIATNVAGALQLRLHAPQGSRDRQTENLEAYTLSLRGRFLWNKRSARSINEALKFFEEALVKDPSYAKAYSGIADCYSILVDRNEMPWAEGGPKARVACERALELNDSLPEAHASLGLLLTREFDYEGAENCVPVVLRNARERGEDG